MLEHYYWKLHVKGENNFLFLVGFYEKNPCMEEKYIVKKNVEILYKCGC
jgi:hypothetical protein